MMGGPSSSLGPPGATDHRFRGDAPGEHILSQPLTPPQPFRSWRRERPGHNPTKPFERFPEHGLIRNPPPWAEAAWFSNNSPALS
jgi:hypothetical protein